MNQYIITEELLQKWKELDYSAKDIYNEARSHPYQSERDTISKELALELCMDARKDATEKVLDGLDGLRKYANGEYKEADLSDNEHDLRIHLEYENRIWGIMKELRQVGSP